MWLGEGGRCGLVREEGVVSEGGECGLVREESGLVMEEGVAWRGRKVWLGERGR